MRTLIYLLGTTLCVATTVGDAFAATGTGGTTATPAANITGPAAEGRRAFLKFNCAGCHGMAATGGMGPNIAREDEVEAVLEGEDGGMPSYRRIVTSTDLTNLSAYLRSIGTPAEPKFVDWWVPVPTK